ncbi:unnamed protein product, partial [Allacma fusca]
MVLSEFSDLVRGFSTWLKFTAPIPTDPDTLDTLRETNKVPFLTVPLSAQSHVLP